MKKLSSKRENCRLCDSQNVEMVFQLTSTPPANAFVKESDREKVDPYFPLDLYFCHNCTHLQLFEIVDPRLLFENYVYVSGTSQVFVEHFKKYAQQLVSQFHPAGKGKILDIGSNDGTFLKAFQEYGFEVLGIDPAKEISVKAKESGIPTITGFFSLKKAEEIHKEFGTFHIITANNIFAHIDDLRDVLLGVKMLLSKEGVFAFEVSYLVDVIEKTLFDTIYHEHLSYHAVTPLKTFFARNGMELIEVIPVDSHGGSIRVVAQLKNGPRPIGNSVNEFVKKEEKLGIHRIETYKRFAQNILKLKKDLKNVILKLKKEKKSVAGFGAPAKATTLMHHFELGPDDIDFIVDDSPWKQGLYSPGYHIPVGPSSWIEEKRPDYLLILAWNFSESIIKKNLPYQQNGGHFIVPLPELKVI